jgi:integrase
VSLPARFDGSPTGSGDRADPGLPLGGIQRPTLGLVKGALNAPAARLHDARHTAATGLLVLDVPKRTVMSIMGRSSASLAARYQHVTDPIRPEVANRVGALLFGEAGRKDA